MVINQGRCELGFVLRKQEGWGSIYNAVPNLPPGVLRGVARYAGVHVYSDSEDVLYPDRHYVALHMVRGKTNRIHLPRRADVWEALDDRLVARQRTAFDGPMAAGDRHFCYYGLMPRTLGAAAIR